MLVKTDKRNATLNQEFLVTVSIALHNLKKSRCQTFTCYSTPFPTLCRDVTKIPWFTVAFLLIGIVNSANRIRRVCVWEGVYIWVCGTYIVHHHNGAPSGCVNNICRLLHEVNRRQLSVPGWKSPFSMPAHPLLAPGPPFLTTYGMQEVCQCWGIFIFLELV